MQKVLIVDDSRTMRNIQKNVLTKLYPECQMTEAGDGLEALTVLASGSTFDLILADWNMPNMDGFRMVCKIREKDKTTPIIMVTTEAEKPRIIEAIKAGVNNYCIKPFTPDVLGEKIKQTLDRARAPVAT
ncbi:MAG TPA: response regulator [Phycisphaerae bacterium]|nr:response regulator [Phycisphaerae bacterium]